MSFEDAKSTRNFQLIYWSDINTIILSKHYFDTLNQKNEIKINFVYNKKINVLKH